jgi:hypothetical protein
MRRPALLLLATAQLLAGCALTIDASKAGVPVTLASAPETPTQGTPFKINTHAVYGLWGIATLREPSLQQLLRSQLVGAKEIRDVRIKVKSGPSDVLATILTLGLIVPRTVVFEGVVPGGTAPGTPAAPPLTTPGAPAPAPR